MDIAKRVEEEKVLIFLLSIFEVDLDANNSKEPLS